MHRRGVRDQEVNPETQRSERSGIWRQDSNGKMIPSQTIEDRVGVANVREIARQLKASNVGAVLWIDTIWVYRSRMMKPAIGKATDTVLAAGKQFRSRIRKDLTGCVGRTLPFCTAST